MTKPLYFKLQMKCNMTKMLKFMRDIAETYFYIKTIQLYRIDYFYPLSSTFYKATSSCQLHVIHIFIFDQ